MFDFKEKGFFISVKIILCARIKSTFVGEEGTSCRHCCKKKGLTELQEPIFR